MTEYAVIFDAATGGHIGNFSGPEGASEKQVLLPGQAIMVVPQAAWSNPPDLAVIKVNCAATIDAAAEAARSRFITPGSGQAMTYLAKQAEAAAFLADSASWVPFLTAEAAATGTTVADLAAAVSANAEAWGTIGAAIEAVRRKAKVELEAASNLAEIAIAGAIDWAAVIG